VNCHIGAFPLDALNQQVMPDSFGDIKADPGSAIKRGARANRIIHEPVGISVFVREEARRVQSPEVVVRKRILAVIDYLSRVQQK
jgi:hypothetical protein